MIDAFSTEHTAVRRRLVAHPRLVAWVVLSTVLIALILLASAGRELNAAQYLGLAAVALVTAAIGVALVFVDGADGDEDSVGVQREP